MLTSIAGLLTIAANANQRNISYQVVLGSKPDSSTLLKAAEWGICDAAGHDTRGYSPLMIPSIPPDDTAVNVIDLVDEILPGSLSSGGAQPAATAQHVAL